MTEPAFDLCRISLASACLNEGGDININLGVVKLT